MQGKLLFVMICFTAIFCGLAGRVYYLKTVKGAEYEQEAISQQITRSNDTTIPPNRGSIVDRNKQPMAVSSTVYNVAVDPVMMKELDDNYKEQVANGNKEAVNVKENVITALNEVIGADKDTLYDIFSVDETTGEPKYNVRFKYVAKSLAVPEGIIPRADFIPFFIIAFNTIFTVPSPPDATTTS